MYWPKEGIETYGVIQVKLVKEEVMATYIVRTFQLKHLKVSRNFMPLHFIELFFAVYFKFYFKLV